MDDRRKRALKRVGRALAAGVVAVLVSKTPELGEVLPRPEVTIPVLTSLLMGLDKALRERA